MRSLSRIRLYCKNLTIRKLTVLVGAMLIITMWCSSYIFTEENWTKLDPPGVIVHKVGGLGNQLFVYACMYSLAKKMQVPLYLEIPSSNILDPQSEMFYDADMRPYVLHKFPVFYDMAVEKWYTKYWPLRYPVFSTKDHDLLYQDEKPFPKDRLIVINDYCQSELFFKDYVTEIKEMFQLQMTPHELFRPPFRLWIDLIKDAGENSVAVHIRRGDYGTFNRDANYWFTPFSFYRTAIKMMLEKLEGSKNVSFFVFSDDMELVKQKLLKGFSLPNNVTIHFVSCKSCTTSLEDFYLMTMCNHMINANSTFSWWAAYLIKNVNKIIIAPAFHPNTLAIHTDEKERKFKQYEMSIFYPKEWIVIDPFTHRGKKIDISE